MNDGGGSRTRCCGHAGQRQAVVGRIRRHDDERVPDAVGRPRTSCRPRRRCCARTVGIESFATLDVEEACGSAQRSISELKKGLERTIRDEPEPAADLTLALLAIGCSDGIADPEDDPAETEARLTEVCPVIEVGLPPVEVTSELACPKGRPERMSACPSLIRGSSVSAWSVSPDIVMPG